MPRGMAFHVEDGGYWLVGVRRTPKIKPIFSGVRWSSVHTLADTLANLEAMSVAMLESLDDVDDAESYRRLGRVASRLVLPALKG